MIHIQTMIAATALSLVAGLSFAEEEVPGGFELGVLTCVSDPDTQRNLIVNSKVKVDCEVEYATGATDLYVGESGIAAGIDLNWKRTDTLKYTIIAASRDTRPNSGALAGKYVGGKGSLTLGVGGGVGALVGGGEKNLTLQPLALEGSKGLGIAAGVSYLILKAAPAE